MAVDESKELVLLGHVGTAWIYDDAFLGFAIVYHIGILGKRIEDKGFELEHDFKISAQR